MQPDRQLQIRQIIPRQTGAGKLQTHYNSRHSLSFDLDLITLNQDTFELEQQFQEIDYAIRLQTPTLTPQQRRESLNKLQQAQAVTAICSDVIEVQSEESKSSHLVPSQEAAIPQIRLSNAHQLLQGKAEMVTVMVILTSEKEISSVKVTLQGGKENQEITSHQEKRHYGQKFVSLCLFCVSFSEFRDLTIKYKEVSRTLLVFSSKMEKEVSLSQARIHENVGLLLNALQDQQPNTELINFCILSAQEHISRRVRELISINPITVAHFHHFLLQHYRPHHSNIQQTYSSYTPSKFNHYATQFFLYFFYQAYREDAVNKLQQNRIIPKLAITRSCSKVVSSKFYQLFQNADCFKEFILYAYFLIATTNDPKNVQLIRSIVKYNILYQSDLLSLRILLRLQTLKERVMTVVAMRKVSAKIICNKEISLDFFMMLRLKALKQMIQEEDRDQECDYKAISTWILEFLNDIIDKVRHNQPQKDDNPNKYQDLIQEILLSKGRLRVTKKDFAILYAKLKFLYRVARGIWQVVMDAVKDSLMGAMPSVLASHYESIIHSLILKPEVAEQNKILIDFFQNHPVSAKQAIFLLQIWLQGKSELYNYVTIEFVLLKLVALNPHFPKIDLQALMQAVEEFTNKDVLPYYRRKEISMFCLKLGKEMGTHENRLAFSLWQKGLFGGEF